MRNNRKNNAVETVAETAAIRETQETVENRDNLSEQQAAILQTEGNTSDVETAAFDAPMPATEQPPFETAATEATQDADKAVAETGETMPSLEELKARANLEEGAPNALSFEQGVAMVRDNEITAEQFAVIFGVDYENDEAEPATPSIGHNNPPDAIDPVAEDMKETLAHWKPQVTSSSEAREALIAAGTDILATQSKLETSLRAKLALKIADYFYFNAEGLAKDGNKLLHVTKDMYRDILKNITELFPKEDVTSTFTATLGSAIETSILLMAGKAVRGFFVLSKDRVAVRDQDIAYPEYPTEHIKEGDMVVESVCIASNVFAPNLPVQMPGNELRWIANESEKLVLLPSYASKAFYNSLWDRDGKLVPDPLRQGRLTSFKSGKDVADEERKARDKAVKDKAAEDAKAKAAPNGDAGTNTPVEPASPTEPDGRAVGGAPAGAEQQDISLASVRTLLNGETVSKEDMNKLRLGVSDLMAKYSALQREHAITLAASSGSLLNSVPALLGVIRQHGPNLPLNAVNGLLNDAREVVLRVIKPKADKPLDETTIKALVELRRQIADIIADTDDDKIIQSNADGQPIKTYDGLNVAA